MQEALDPTAQVKDDLPGLRAELGDWWEKHLKPLVDFRSFLRQRRAILTNHDLARSTKTPYDGWKNPFAFALSASTLTFTIVALIGVGFHTLFPEPDLEHDWIARHLQTQLSTVRSELSRGAARDRTFAALAVQREQLEADIKDHASGLTVPHEGIVLTAGIPLVVYFLGVVFPSYVKRRVPGAAYASNAREIAYYYFTARTFWPFFFLVTGGAVYFFLMKYSLLNTYDEFPDTFPVSRGPLFALLATIAALGAIPFFYALVGIPISLHKCAHEISGVLGVNDDARAKRAIYWGFIGTIVASCILSLTLTVTLAGVYTVVDSGSQSVRAAMGSSLSTSPAGKN